MKNLPTTIALVLAIAACNARNYRPVFPERTSLATRDNARVRPVRPASTAHPPVISIQDLVDSCDDGVAKACARLGDLYASGSSEYSVVASSQRAVYYYERACLRGHPPSCEHAPHASDVRHEGAPARPRTPAPAVYSRRPVAAAPATCFPGAWVEEVLGDGEIVRLSDQSLWQVDSADTFKTQLWLPADSITICGDVVVNTRSGDTVQAQSLDAARAYIGSSKWHVVEAASNDEIFVVNGEVFKARTYCFNIRPGDRVLFVKGNPRLCTSAEFLVQRTSKVCRVWCE